MLRMIVELRFKVGVRIRASRVGLGGLRSGKKCGGGTAKSESSC